MNYTTPVQQIKGVGEVTAKAFQKLDISTVGELLHYLPRDYEQYEEPIPVNQIKIGEICAIHVCITGIVSERTVRKGRSLLSFRAADATGSVILTFFNSPFLKKVLKQGQYFVFRGKPTLFGQQISIEQPAHFLYGDYISFTECLLPKYSLTKGLTNTTIQKTVQKAILQYSFEEEYYPDVILDSVKLITEKEALETIHYPESRDALLSARKRLVFDEFFSFLYFLRQNKEYSEGLPNKYEMFETADTVRFLEALPFPLTKAQKKVWQEIRNDLGSQYCMNRLIQGDVGSGKTIIAALALMMTVANGYQGALMAPTEVLAAQHFETFMEYKNKYNVNISPILLVGSMTAAQKKEAYAKIASGEANLIIGTHALIQNKVTYKSLALVVTDEQHRFGVRQREALSEKGESPHILVMSATPIPRTLAIIMYGDLKISVIDELPANRKPIKNCVVNTSYRATAYKFIASQVAEGRQVYVICPQVEAGELEDLENVVDYTETLRSALPANIQVSYLHGKMRPAEKNRIMEEFAAHHIDVLVSTTVIEVGINVPNATVMMVENSDRFGLAQLHQLRGRVGRGEHQSYCIFISGVSNKETMERLQILNSSNDGFYIASQDLKLRGPGDMFGIRQSGDFAFRVADIYTDSVILQQASEILDNLLTDDPLLQKDENAGLKKHLDLTSLNFVDFRTI